MNNSLLLYEHCRCNNYSVKKEDIGLLYFLFSGIPVYLNEVSPFVKASSFVYIGVKPLDTKKDYVYISLGVGKDLLDKEVFTGVLGEILGLKKKYLAFLGGLEGEQFWFYVKLFFIGVKDGVVGVEGGSVISLFFDLFQDFEKIYKTYRGLNLDHKVVFSGLMSVFLKVKASKESNIFVSNPRYLQKLQETYIKIPVIERAIETYLLDMSEVGLVNMLRLLSRDKGFI